ncbi:pao retrotransposon peptidase domain-containing protein [Phthorimaea operculella]|nr:pao retrotransposon peptidase domain-containing protein [Phthorimaea operculella]
MKIQAYFTYSQDSEKLKKASSSGNEVRSTKMEPERNQFKRRTTHCPLRPLIVTLYIICLATQSQAQTVNTNSQNITKNIENLDIETPCHRCQTSNVSFVEEVIDAVGTFTKDYILVNKTEKQLENEIEGLVDGILSKDKYEIFDGVEIKKTNNTTSRDDDTRRRDDDTKRSDDDTKRSNDSEGRALFPKYSYEYRLYQKVKNFIDTHVLSINLSKAARFVSFRSFGLKKFFVPLLIGAQVFKSILLAMFLPSILGSFGKILGKAAMIGREDREDALLKSALQADERVRVVSEHLTECLMLLEEAPNPEDKELVEGDVPLPPVTVPVFAGDYADWPAFEDLYSSVVHTRTDITPAYKMAQLMSRLHGEPHELLTHLAVSDSNYEVAWKILTDRYRNKRLIVDRLASPPAERNGRSIRAATWGKYSDHLPTYEDLKSFLEAESRRVDVQAGEAPRKETSPLATRNGRVHRREEATVGNPGGTTPHWNQGVPTAGRQATGWQRVRSLLRSGFRGDGVWHSRGVGVFGAWGRIRCECPSSTNCRYCQGAHHPLLCMNRSGGAGAALDRISEGACPPREGNAPTLQGGAHLRIGHRDRQGDVNRRSPLTQGRGDNPHHGSRCRIGEERHRNVAKDTHPSLETSGPTRRDPVLYGSVLSEVLQRFWESEEPPTADRRKPEDDECELFYQYNTARCPSGRFVTRLPFLPNRPALGIVHIAIPRKLVPSVGCKATLHGFCDASERGYAAAVYLRTASSTGTVHVRLVMAKSKVAPVRTRWTIPKLELAGAALLARLLNHVTCNLRGTINLDETVYAWTDSRIVLCWLQTSVHTLEVFVANRVSQITGSETPLVWRHVPGEWNPADCASRGCRAPDLVSHPLWWGPQWLTESPQEWPFNECRAPLGPPDRGLRVNVGQLVPKPNPAFLLERYSSSTNFLG